MTADRLTRAIEWAERTIAGAPEGTRSNRSFSAAAFVGSFCRFDGYSRDAIETRLIHAARAAGLPAPEARKHVVRGVTMGEAKPLDPADAKAGKRTPLPTETWEQLCARKRLDPIATADRWQIEQTTYADHPAIRYPVAGALYPRIRILTVPAGPRWQCPPGRKAEVDTIYPMPTPGATGPLLLVNGESAVWAMHAAGIEAHCTCIGEGASLGPRALSILASTGRPVWVIYDRDKAGIAGAWKKHAELTAAGVPCRVLDLPADLGEKGDAGDLWIRYGAQTADIIRALPDLPSADPQPLLSPAPLLDPPPAPATQEPEPPTPIPTTLTPEPPTDGAYIIATVPDAPCPRALRAPTGYAVTESGVWRMKEDGTFAERISTTPIILTRTMADVATGQQHVELQVRAPKSARWTTIVATRDQAMVGRKAAELTAQGLSITSQTAAAFVCYAAAAEVALADCGAPVELVTARTGWHGASFLLGTDPMLRPGSKPDAAPRWHGSHGARTVVESVSTSGTLTDWRASVWPAVQHHPTMAAVIAAACVAPLLEVLRCEPFALDICGETSTGKSTSMYAAASVWGSRRYQRSWEATRVGIERVAAIIYSLPLIMDDTARAEKVELCGRIVYDIVAAEGRIRGLPQPGGIDVGAQFQTVILSTGEGPLAMTMEGAGGLRARCLSLWGPPLGPRSESSRQMADHIALATRDHYGHAGRALVVWLLAQTPDALATLRQQHRDEAMRLSAVAANLGSPVAGRQASHAAAIRVAGRCLESALGLPHAIDWLSDTLFTRAVQSSRQADRPLAALERVLTWGLSQPDALCTSPSQVAPRTGKWVGALTRPSTSAPILYILPGPASDELTRAGYHPHEVVSSWRERGWIRTSEENRLTARVQIGPVRLRAWQFTQAAIAAAGVDLDMVPHETVDTNDSPF
jgi:hypothetical protein